MNSFDKVSSDNVQIHTITRKKANSKDFQVGQSQTYSDYLGSERGEYKHYSPLVNFRYSSGFFTSRGVKSRHSYHAITPDCFRRKEIKPAQKASPLFHHYFFEWNKKEVAFLESTDFDRKKVISSTAPESAKNVDKICSQRTIRKLVGGL